MRSIKLLVVALTPFEATAIDDQSCRAIPQSKSCQSNPTDAPSVGNAQLQVKLDRQNLQPVKTSDARHDATQEISKVTVASFASITRTSLSQKAQTLQMQKASAGVQLGMERMAASWDGSMNEINNLIGSMIDHESSSEDGCSSQLQEYKTSLVSIHESTTSTSVEVNSTASQVSIYEKECKEKNEELTEIETLETEKMTKCVTVRSVQKKTMETLRYDMTEMKHVAKAHIHLQAGQSVAGRFPTHRFPGHSLLETDENLKSPSARASLREPPSHERVANVQSMVQKTKDMAAKVSGCMAKAKMAQNSLMENSSRPVDDTGAGFTEMHHSANEAGQPWDPPQPHCEGPEPRCFPVSCGPEGWTCGAIDTCSDARPMCHPISCVQGRWQCGAVSGPEYSACDGKLAGELCHYGNSRNERDPAVVGSCVVTGLPPMRRSEEHGNEIYDFLEVGMETSPLVNSELKCVADDAPTECKEVVLELEHQFTVSYVSLTRMIEEYEVITHSTVCEETVTEEYTRESSSVQEEANKVCSDVQSLISKLEKYKFQYQSSVKTEVKMENSIRLLIKQCGSLTSTETYLEDVKDTLGAIGSCPGIGDVTFRLPTWVGEWAKFDQDRQKSNDWNDDQMAKVCTNQFGSGSRPAEVSEIDGQGVEGMPTMNTADFPVLGACPLCKGSPMFGLTLTGFGRVCWDSGEAFSRYGRRSDCGGGPRNIMCVFDGSDLR